MARTSALQLRRMMDPFSVFATLVHSTHPGAFFKLFDHHEAIWKTEEIVFLSND